MNLKRLFNQGRLDAPIPLIATAALFAFGQGALAAPFDKTGTTVTIVAFGDSTTAPRAKDNLAVYADRVKARMAKADIPVNVINAGIGGNTTDAAKARFEKDVLARHPALVVIQFGINDSCVDVWKTPPATAPRVNLKDYTGNLEYFIRELTNRNCKVILMTPNAMRWTPVLQKQYGQAPYAPNDVDGFNVTLRQYAEAVRNVAKQADVALVDVYAAFQEYGEVQTQSTDALLLDGMHPNDKGQELVANLLFPEILKLKDKLAGQRPATSDANKSEEQIQWDKMPDRDKKNPAFRIIADDPKLPRVLLIGDSISIGYTDTVRKELAGLANVHRIMANGGVTTYGLGRLKIWLGSGKWDVIHFNWGLHDISQVKNYGVTPQQYATNLSALVVMLKASGAKLIWATTTPVPDGADGRSKGDVAAYNSIAETIMRQNGIGINDLYACVLPNLDKLQRPKNVHFKEEGSEFLGKKVAGEIKQQLLAGPAAKAVIPACRINAPAAGNHAGDGMPVKPVQIDNSLEKEQAAWWKLQSNAMDSIGANHGKAENIIFSNDGDLKFAVFNGTNSCVKINPAGSFVKNKQIAISAWVRIKGDFPAKSAVIVGQSGYADGWRLMVGNAGTVTNALCLQVGTGKSPVSVGSQTGLQKDQWQHVLALWDGVWLKIYIDGELSHGGHYSGDYAEPAYWLGIGYNSLGTVCFKGHIRDVRIWNRAVSRQEIKELYKDGLKAAAN